MSYLVLARKWRPQRFEDIVGQDHIARVLKNAIRAGRVAHAYLFTGVRGVGKTTAARILAKALNCEKGPTPEPCNQCTLCDEITAGSSIDVYEIDGASNRGIDEVRQIIENVRYQPANSRFKIYIIDEVHQVTKDAFNALLKTLEEPPPYVKFILATTEPHRLPETILSRCQRFDFRRIPARQILQRLARIAGTEGLRISEGALLLIAREAEGSMRDAESLLEQVLSYVSPSGKGEGEAFEVDERLLQEILGIAERGVLYELSEAVIKGDARRCLELVADIAAQGRDIPRLSRDLVEHFRNCLIARLAQEGESRGGSAVLGRLIDLPDHEIEEIKRQASGLSPDTLMDYFRFMSEGDEEIARSSYPRFALEATLVRLATLPQGMMISEALERLAVLEKKLSAKPKEGMERDESASSPSPSGDERDEAWKKFVAFVMGEKKLLGLHLEKAYPLDLAPGRLRIGAQDRHHLSYLQDPENLAMLRDFARRFFSGEVNVVVAPVSSKNQAEKEERKEPPGRIKHDVVEEALRIFGGSIVKKES